MIERKFDVPLIANLALREKQIQQNYRPVIAVHKWFARRPGTLFRGLILSEFGEKPLRDIFYEMNRFPGIQIADPFMGGGTPLIEANRLGCDVIGTDINPMAYWIVKQEMDHLDLQAYRTSASLLREELEKEIGHLYRTRCGFCNSIDAQVKYFLWVKVKKCEACGHEIDLFPGYLLAADSRHPKNVYICSACNNLTETVNRKNPGVCSYCMTELAISGPAKRSHCKCPACGTDNVFPEARHGPPRHRLFAIEYHCQSCKPNHNGRFFKKPDSEDLSRVLESAKRWDSINPKFVPDDKIPSGDETNRLHRWGYTYYRQMFNTRQLLGLELSARLVARNQNERVRNALATNLSDLLRYQNMLCRYDTRALKSLDIFSIHGFPVGLVQCESNFLGIMGHHKNICIGSGGWANIIEKYYKAKSYCDAPFEVKYNGRKKVIIPVKGEWIGDHTTLSNSPTKRIVDLSCEDAASLNIPPGSLDAVFTDPPYFGNVQYAELMDFCYVWLRRLVGRTSEEFKFRSTRNPNELTGNESMGRGLNHFTEGLSAVFQRMAKALKSGSPLAFTYHHNNIEAYYPVAVSILDAGFVCSASLPCPAEMGASIHINGTGSSIIDTVLVCRSTGTVPRKWLVNSPDGVAQLVEEDMRNLKHGNVIATLGDIKCITYGHLIRLAVWSLRHEWNKLDKTAIRIAKVVNWLKNFGGWPEVEKHINSSYSTTLNKPLYAVRESSSESGEEDAYISF